MQIISLRNRTTVAVVLCLLLLESLPQASFATNYDFVESGNGATLVRLSTDGSDPFHNILGLSFTAKGSDWAQIRTWDGMLLDHYDVGPYPGTFIDEGFWGVYSDGAGGLKGPLLDHVTILSSQLRFFFPQVPRFELGFTDSYNGDSLRFAAHSHNFPDVVANGNWREVPPVYWAGAVSSAWTGGVLNGQSNWTSDSAGTSFRLGDPGPECDVYFSSANLPAGIPNTTLGKDFTIKSLTISDPSNVTINSQTGTSQTLTIAGGNGIDIQSGAGTVFIGANVAFSSGTNTITVNNSAATYITGAISGTDGLNLVSTNGQGYLILTGTNNYTGGTTISSGLSVQVGVYGATGTLSSGPVVNNGNLLIARNNAYKIFSGISGTGTLYKMGDGTTTLSGTNTYTGGTFVNAGRLLVNGTATGVVQVDSGGTLGGTGLISGAVTVNSGGHLAPGASVDSLYVGSLVLNPGSILDFELGAPGSPGINSDLINVTASGGLTISGGSVALTNAGGLAVGTYTLIDYVGTLGGAVANLGTPTGPAGFSYALINNATNKSIDLTVSAAGLLGDYNLNGIVDAADYVVWRKNPGGFPADAYATWRSHFGQPPGSGSGANANAAVPEPASLVLLMFAAAGWCLRRGRAA